MKFPQSILLFIALALSSSAWADALDERIAELQHGWAVAYYSVPEAQKNSAFEQLETRAEQLTAQNPGRAEPLVWQAIVLSSHAKFQGGLGALSKVKRARDLLFAAEKIKPDALDGSIYASLGSLYANVPGWPIAYGDQDKAAMYLQKALQLNPDGIDPNFFYGELLAKRGDKASAERALRKALAAPARPGREDADSGRQAEIRAALKSLAS